MFYKEQIPLYKAIVASCMYHTQQRRSSIMNVKQELINYIEMNETPGALMLTGEWGCGKTFLINEIANEYNPQGEKEFPKDDNKEKRIVLISLFGVTSVVELQGKVKRSVLQKISPINDKAGKWIEKGFNIVKGILPDKFRSLLSIDLLDIVDIDTFINPENLILVFDDFERCSCKDRIALLGCINDYIESKRIKVIIVANEEKIVNESADAEKYRDYKEKVICRTINLRSNFEEIMKSLVGQYKETAIGYSAFLSTNLNVLYRVFTESGMHNIRLMKYIMADFERIYDTWQKSGISEDYMPFALYSFAAEYLWSRSPKESESKNEWAGYHNKKAERFPLLGERNSQFCAFESWINSGEWNETKFVAELNNHYGIRVLTPEQGFLFIHFWEMEQECIDKGMPAAIDKAYRGELTHDELTLLIQKIWGLRKNGIPFPCDVDYGKILDGYCERLNRMKLGKIVYDSRYSFAMPEQIEDDAKPINELLEKTDDLLAIFDNRRNLLNCVDDPYYDSWYQFTSKIFVELDDEMTNSIWDAYSNGDNHAKRKIGAALSKIRFFYSTLSNLVNLKTTQANYAKLIASLEDAIMQCDEFITKLILQSTLTNIQERANEVDEEICKLSPDIHTHSETGENK